MCHSSFSQMSSFQNIIHSFAWSGVKPVEAPVLAANCSGERDVSRTRSSRQAGGVYRAGISASLLIGQPASPSISALYISAIQMKIRRAS